MKKVFSSAGFAALGLIASWAAVRIVESVNWSGLTYRWPEGRCWELDHCAVPWYGVLLFFGFLLLPTIVHGLAGWRLGASGASLPRVGIKVTLLFAGTLAFFVIGRFASGVP